MALLSFGYVTAPSLPLPPPSLTSKQKIVGSGKRKQLWMLFIQGMFEAYCTVARCCGIRETGVFCKM